ncbi:hypothetical protein LOC67_16620 [Stieleria sp. JC731]|uniref:hypothetical protein n=1 Tax=Pirellulaceae TaxID=2691357 RepID=UPI001E36A7C9|nr:hypothetical protein [Stieleria sp. JC731]MCC9602183.1 hypothetical protein [Stieleria sp. JC731]
MNSLFYNSIRKGKRQQQLGLLLLLTISFALTGFVAVPDSPRHSSSHGEFVTLERFPCENCGCGCQSAEQCWDRCCCHNDAEKLRWAAANDVQPPDFLVKRAAGSEATSTPRARCRHCQAKPTPQASSKVAADSDAIVKTTRVVLLWKAAQCRGLKSIWSIFSAVFLADPLVINVSRPATDRVDLIDDSGTSRRDCPDPPVP